MNGWWRLLVQQLELFLTSINSRRKFSDSILAWRTWFFFRIILWFEFIQLGLNSFKFCAKLVVWRILLGLDIQNIILNSINYSIQLLNQFGILLIRASLKVFHLFLNILDAFVSHGPCRLLSTRISFFLITFPLSILNKLFDLFLKTLIILSKFGV